MYNPVVAKCSACGSRCKLQWQPCPQAWATHAIRCLVSVVVWFVFRTVALRAVPNTPEVEVTIFLLAIVMGVLTSITMNRVYHAIWAWRHPVRCQGGGEPELAPTV
jgi:hypothetical protein